MMNQRVYITKPGEASVLKLIDEPLKEIAENEVRVKVIATGVAFADMMMRKGKYPGAPGFPFVPGHEVVGVVENIGREVTNFKKGQFVASFCKYGGYSRFVHLLEKDLVLIPDGVDLYEAAAIILNYLTAYQLLYRIAEVQKGNTVLAHGLGGGVGTALLQLSKELDIKLYGTASAKDRQKFISEGVFYIDYRTEDFVKRMNSLEPNGVDVVFDGVGGFNWQRSYQTLKRDGLFIGYGFTYAAEDSVQSNEQQFMVEEWNRILHTEKTSSGHKGKFYSISKVSQQEPNTILEDLNQLFKLLKEYKIKPKIAHKVPLEEAVTAHQLFEKGIDGKILLICQ
ncbi:medium chain dehydrogenase/reductase family protein [Neobacillus sp. D3-1R]|uniref:medium chain dehydrogenase/reductase family protein n=1 Tax=Neobacillus sp. D3-1R TaxID=3445778 RepID=UPI003FA03D90